jgi:hypothetical protein
MTTGDCLVTTTHRHPGLHTTGLGSTLDDTLEKHRSHTGDRARSMAIPISLYNLKTKERHSRRQRPMESTESDSQPYPRGPIPSVEPYHSYSAFLQAAEPEYTLLKYTDMRTLVNRGETATSYFPDETSVITTTTIRDTPLNLLTWEQELEHVLAFQSDYHIPADYSTYENQDLADRSRNTLHCMEGLLWMQRQLREHDSDTQLIPLVKGTTPEERAVCYEIFERAGFDAYCAFYGTQYFSGGAGIRIDELVADLDAVATEQDRDIFLIGLLSPNYLKRVPGQVVAAAGQTAWRKHISATNQETAEIQEHWTEFTTAVADALGTVPSERSPTDTATTDTEVA